MVYLEKVNPQTVTSIDVPDFIYKIGALCFCGYLPQEEANTTEVILHEGLTKIGDHAFINSGITSIYIPSTVDDIGVQAFQDCMSLTSVEFGENIRIDKLPGTVFEYCESLEEITVPASVCEIEPDAFSGCTSLNKITFEDPGTSWHIHRKHNGIEEDYDEDYEEFRRNFLLYQKSPGHLRQCS